MTSDRIIDTGDKYHADGNVVISRASARAANEKNETVWRRNYHVYSTADCWTELVRMATLLARHKTTSDAIRVTAEQAKTIFRVYGSQYFVAVGTDYGDLKKVRITSTVLFEDVIELNVMPTINIRG